MVSHQYLDGLAALLAGDLVTAADLLGAEVAVEPDDPRAFAALAVAQAQLRDGDGAARALAAAARRRAGRRRDRNHVSVIGLLLTGHEARGTALAREHLAEFPDDDLVRYVLALHDDAAPGAGGSAAAQAPARTAGP